MSAQKITLRRRRLHILLLLLFNITALVATGFWMFDIPKDQAVWPALLVAFAAFFVIECMYRLRGPQEVSISDHKISVAHVVIGCPRQLREFRSTSAVLIGSEWVLIPRSFRGDRGSFIEAVCMAIASNCEPVPCVQMPAGIPTSIDERLSMVWADLSRDALGIIAWSGPGQLDIPYSRRAAHFAGAFLLVGIVCAVALNVGGVFLIVVAVCSSLFGVTWRSRGGKQSILVYSDGLSLAGQNISGDLEWSDFDSIISVRPNWNGWSKQKKGSPCALQLRTHDGAEIVLFDQYDVPLSVIRSWIMCCSREIED